MLLKIACHRCRDGEFLRSRLCIGCSIVGIVGIIVAGIGVTIGIVIVVIVGIVGIVVGISLIRIVRVISVRHSTQEKYSILVDHADGRLFNGHFEGPFKCTTATSSGTESSRKSWAIH